MKYEPVGFELRIWMPSTVVPMDRGLSGSIEAIRIGDGLPIFGSLSIDAKVSSQKKGTANIKIRNAKTQEM